MKKPTPAPLPVPKKPDPATSKKMSNMAKEGHRRRVMRNIGQAAADKYGI